jgi:hypothetical protein
MAGRKTDYYEARIQGHIFGARWDMRVPIFWLALTTSAPTDAAAGTEVAVQGYRRTRIVNVTSFWTEPTTGEQHGEVSNRFTFSTTTLREAALVSHIELWDAATAGNRLYWGVLVNDAGVPTPIWVLPGHRLRFKVGKFRIRED